MAVTDCTVEAQKILSCIVRMHQRYGSGKVADVLLGHDTSFVRENHFDRLSTYGVMRDYTDKDIRDIISLLVAEGYLRVEGDGYAILKLTEHSKRILRGEETIAINKPLKEPERHRMSQSVENIHAYDKALFQQLRSTRAGIADTMGVPPFVIFSDRSLIDMAAKLPLNDNEMRDVSGVGEKKLERYGTPFIMTVRTYVEQNHVDVEKARVENFESVKPRSVGSNNKGVKRTTQSRTLELIKQGMSIDSIARERKLSWQTIQGHVVQLVENGENLPIEKWITQEECEMIQRTAALSHSDKLTPIKDALPEEISFFQIKLALALSKRHVQR